MSYLQFYAFVFAHSVTSVCGNNVISVVLWLCICVQCHIYSAVDLYVINVIFVVLSLCTCQQCHIRSAVALYL